MQEDRRRKTEGRRQKSEVRKQNFRPLFSVLCPLSVLILCCALARLTYGGQAGFSQPPNWSIVPSGSLTENSAAYKQGEVIVRFVDGAVPQISGPRTTRAIRDAIANSIISGSFVDKEYDQLVPGLTLVKLPQGVEVFDAVIRFNQSPDVFYAEPNYKIRALIVPNDPRFIEQWGLNNIGQTGGRIDADIDAPEAWDILNSSPGIIVAVTDSGIDYNHPDLNANMWINDGEVNQPGIFDPNDINDVDDDGNGYNDDIFGYDFVDDDWDPMDENFHGTHVAGIIGAVGNNEEGIAGVCWAVKLMALRILDPNGVGETADAISAIRYATTMGASIINASWGDYNYNQALYDAIAAAGDAGIIFVATAGNNGFDFAIYPAGYDLDNIISVMATDHFDNRDVFSNYGLEDVDLGAPGVAILSTTPTEETQWMSDNGIPTDYAYASGTSASAPHVSGAAALIRTLNPAFTPLQVKLIIMRAVDPTLPGLCVSGGRLNLFNALHMSRQGVVLNTRTNVRYGSIQQAINEARNGDKLIADADYWYIEPIDFLGKEITVRSGDVNAPPSYGVVLPANTYISALFSIGTVVTFNSGEGINSILSGFTVTDGDKGIHVEDSTPQITDCNVTMNAGVGIYCIRASPMLSRCTVSKNTAKQDGGGIYCDSSNPNITNCIVLGNMAGRNGGGIYCDNNSSPKISDATIARNFAAGAGGGIYSGQSSDPNISNSTISSNQALWAGGGIYTINCSPQISDCTIAGNTTAWDGGGIYCDTRSNPNIRNCTIDRNIADYDGGGIYCNGGSFPIKNCLITNNTVDSWDGGGIFCADASPAITNCTFAGNSANAFDGLGGAVYCAGFSRPVITNCIFSGNHDRAIYEQDEGSDPVIKFCLFYNNPQGDYYDADTSIAFTGAAQINNIPGGSASDNIDGNPMFVPGRLGNYYLSQYAAGQVLDANGQIVDPNVNPQDATSPAVNAGSTDAKSLGMHIYSTRTDNLPFADGNKDSGRVDIGYHYNDPQGPRIYILTTVVQPVGSGSIYPAPNKTHICFQYSQIPLIARPADPNVYQFKSWSGTDDDTRMDRTSTGGIAVIQKNIVTMDSDKTVTVRFETILVTLRTRVVGGNGTVSPRGGQYLRGTVVELVAIPVNPSHRCRWNGSDNDFSTLRNNTVTMSEPFVIDPRGREFKEVEVRFYAPRTINVPGNYTSIQAAIDDANDGDIIIIAPSGQPYLTVWGHFIDKAITIASTNPDDPNVVARTVVQLQSAGPDGLVGRGFVFYDVGPDTLLNGITITGFNVVGLNGEDGDPADGYYDGVPGESVYGAAILCYAASPTIKNCIITDNSATGGNGGNGANGDDDHPAGGHGGWPGGGYGGGIACLVGSNPTVINCTFENCAAIGGNGGNGGNGDDDPWGPGGRGGGWYYPYPPEMYVGGYPYEWGPFDFYTEYSGHGGALYCDAISSPTFTDCNFTDNRTESGNCGISGITPPNFRAEPTINWLIDNSGGAIYIAPYPEYFFDFGIVPVVKSEAKFQNCTFSNNIADPNVQLDNEDFYVSYGGAVDVAKGAIPTFSSCTFNNNLATVGGAMYWEYAEPVIDDCNFVANSALQGGGAYFVGGSAQIIRSNFRENDANGVGGGGGAIYCFDANAVISDCSITSNDADTSGGGIYFSGSEKVAIKNCLIASNAAGRDGGGISADWHSQSQIRSCTIANNLVTGSQPWGTGYGGGLACTYESFATVIDSIFWGNLAAPLDANDTGDQISVGTGFKFDTRPATVTVKYCDIKDWRDPKRAGRINPGAIFVDRNCFLNFDTASIIDKDPLFVSDYYLSQTAAGHDRNSHCVDAGSAQVIDPNVLMQQYTTRVDGVNDIGFVDMGYHHIVERFSLTITVVGGNGTAGLSSPVSIDLKGPVTFNRDVVVTVKAVPNAGFGVNGWYDVNDVLVSTSRTFDVVMDSDKFFTLKFEKRSATTVSGGGNAIQQAIDAAKSGQTLIVAAGTYNGNISLRGKDITLASANPDDPTVVASTIINCQQSGRGFIFNSGEDANTVVDGFTIINGSLAGQGGAGIYIDPNSSPTIMNVTISNCNVTGSNGGGIYVDVNSAPTFINCTVTDCSADGGGGAFCDFNSAPIFNHCTFSDNSANVGAGIYYDANCAGSLLECTFNDNQASLDGGGLLCDPNGIITVADCNFISNSAIRGAGLFGRPDSKLTVANSLFSGNAAANDGGAMYWLAATMVITDCNIIGNLALRGGGLYCDTSGDTKIAGCIIQDNRAGVDGLGPLVVGQGGGMYCFNTLGQIRDSIITRNIANTSGGGMYIAGEPNSPQLINCLMTDNVAGRDGGGATVTWASSPVIANCTFYGNAAAGSYGEPNSAGFGGGLYCSYGSNTALTNSIFWNNFALDGHEIAVGKGFRLTPRCATLTVSYSDLQEGRGGVTVDDGCILNWAAGNIDRDPLFVTGPLDAYYLSQRASGQGANSPAVNAGSDFASKVGLFAFTTRTDGMSDTGIVDMGYHRPTVQPCRFCDLVFDGIISFSDFAKLVSKWLLTGCSDINTWCSGADLTFDTHVGYEDLAFFTDCWLVEDVYAPTPNPSEWETAPYRSAGGSISMTAKIATDAWGWPVQYYFDCVRGNCHDSGWQNSPTYTDSGLAPGTNYSYRVKARDTSPRKNETEWSTIAYASVQDVTPPAPAPTWQTQPTATSPTEITMVATTAYDDSGVEYYFDATTAGGHDSGWQDSPTYTDTGLTQNTQYCYRVKARDKSPNRNETVWSPEACVTTPIPIETIPPTPNPMQFDPNGAPTEIYGGGGPFDYYATMTAVVATDASGGIEYFFECIDAPGLSSGWQASNTYTVAVGRGGQGLRFRVKARDMYGNETGWSPAMPALPANRQ